MMRLSLLGSSGSIGTQAREVVRNLRAQGEEVQVAALAARGQSRIAGCGYIDRGYPALEAMLGRLGARIRREMPPKPAD